MKNFFVLSAMFVVVIGCGKIEKETEEAVATSAKVVNDLANKVQPAEVDLALEVDRLEVEREESYVPKSVTVDFKPTEMVDLENLAFGVADKEKMFQDDKEFEDGYQSKNSHREFKTRFGTFRIVYCFGRQSIDPEAFNRGGMRHDMIQLPSGSWIAGWPIFPNIRGIFEVDNATFVVCDHEICKMEGPDKWVSVVQMVNTGYAFDTPFIDFDDGLIDGKFIEVHRTSASNFGGLLEYTDGKWTFHSYMGSVRGWINATEKIENGNLIFTMYGKNEKIVFNPMDGKFDDI